MAEASSKASPLYPHHCYRVVTFNVSEVHIGESNQGELVFLIYAHVVCRRRRWELQGWMMDTKDHFNTRLEANSYDQAF